MNDEIKENLSEMLFNRDERLYNYITNLQQQLHQASLDIQELTEKDIGCPSWCDKLTNLQQLEQEHKKINGELREENSKLEIALQNIQEDYDRRIEQINYLNEELEEELNEYKFPNCKTKDIEVVRANLVDMMRKNKRLEQENEKLKEENNNKAMNDYAHAIDESWYRELYDDYKSRCEKASEILKKLDLNKYTYTKENRKHTINDLLNILQNGSDSQ